VGKIGRPVLHQHHSTLNLFTIGWRLIWVRLAPSQTGGRDQILLI
jgi:hypothetical protein